MTKGEIEALKVFPIDASRNTKLVRYYFGKGYDKGYKDAKSDFIKYALDWIKDNLPDYTGDGCDSAELINDLKNYLVCK